MDRLERRATFGRQTDGGTARQILYRIADPRSPGRHHGGAGYFPRVHEAGTAKSPAPKAAASGT
jgi:hypothetical protein